MAQGAGLCRGQVIGRQGCCRHRSPDRGTGMAVTALLCGRHVARGFSSGAQQRSGMAGGADDPGVFCCRMIRRRSPRTR